MKTMIQGRGMGRLGRILVGATALFVFTATPAFADTSEASANALMLNLGSGSVIDSGTCTAESDGTTATQSGVCTPSTTILDGVTLVTAGVLTQSAVANNDGTSAACAGLLGSGGTISIGTNPPCVASTPGSGGVTLLDGAIVADAIIARCSADAGPPPTATGSVDIINLRTGGPVPVPLFNGPAAPNTGLTIPGVATLIFNKQPVPQAPGQFTTTALELTVLGDAVTLAIGTVTCGPNVDVPIIPVIPANGLPVAAATVAVVGAGAAAVAVRRRRASTPSAA